MKPQNRLAAESSPYLRQHMHNPVDWFPWGDEAFAKARAEDKPVLLSIGYAACHWCHVMERESFEDEGTAALMNQLYVSIKVDREERPDVDAIYQGAVQLMRQSGGWPLTAFLLPDGRCFYVGTYFPDEPRHGMPSFREVLQQVARAYHERRDDVERAAGSILQGLERIHAAGSGAVPGPDLLAEAADFLAGRMDPVHGGFGSRPKFPSPSNTWVAWRHALESGDARCRDLVLLMLRKMAAGGIYDQLGGGFHRYSTDEEWLVPHFEKMLYDNAQLVPLYASAWHATGDRDFLRVVEETLTYLCRDMQHESGAFYATTDADSEGEEGKFFVWTPQAVRAVLGDDALAERFCRAYDVTPEGNWEGHSILRRVGDVNGLDDARAALLAARYQRIPPLRDEKIIASWNGLAIGAFVAGYHATGSARWLEEATRCGEALVSRLVIDGRLQHSRCGDDVKGPAFLDDHAAVGEAFVLLFEATGERRWLDRALGLAVAMEGDFFDRAAGAWFMTPAGGERLVVRPRDAHDSATPSGTALAASFLQRLAVHDEDPRWTARVEDTLSASAEALESNPYATGHMLGVLDTYHRGFVEVIVGGADADALVDAARGHLGPRGLLLRLEALPEGHPLAEGRRADSATAWVCRGQSCAAPVHEVDALVALLGAS